MSTGKANVATSVAKAFACVLEARHMVDIEAIKCVSQLDGCMVIRYQVFMTNLVLFLDLINNQFEVTISFKVLYSHLLSEPEANE